MKEDIPKSVKFEVYGPDRGEIWCGRAHDIKGYDYDTMYLRETKSLRQ